MSERIARTQEHDAHRVAVPRRSAAFAARERRAARRVSRIATPRAPKNAVVAWSTDLAKDHRRSAACSAHLSLKETLHEYLEASRDRLDLRFPRRPRLPSREREP